MKKTHSLQHLIIRKAVETDIRDISKLLAHFGEKALLLPRTEEDVRTYLSNFLVAEQSGRFAGCVAVRDFGNSLYEIRSLAVAEEFAGRGIGSALVREAVERRRGPGVRVFALTHRANLFLKEGFHQVDKTVFPEKIWSDCSQCPKIDHCDEVAVLCLPS